MSLKANSDIIKEAKKNKNDVHLAAAESETLPFIIACSCFPTIM